MSLNSGTRQTMRSLILEIATGHVPSADVEPIPSATLRGLFDSGMMDRSVLDDPEKRERLIAGSLLTIATRCALCGQPYPCAHEQLRQLAADALRDPEPSTTQPRVIARTNCVGGMIFEASYKDAYHVLYSLTDSEGVLYFRLDDTAERYRTPGAAMTALGAKDSANRFWKVVFDPRAGDAGGVETTVEPPAETPAEVPAEVPAERVKSAA